MGAMADGAKRLSFGIVMVGTKKSLGQHWLKNRAILDEIAMLASRGLAVACPSDDSSQAALAKSSRSAEHVTASPLLAIEIGPGLGFLTSSLLKRFERVIAVEYDDRLADNLPKSFPGKNLEVVNGDILDFDFSTIKEEYVIAGNIPYYITSPIIEKVLTAENKPKRVVLLMQKEVAERITSDKETVLSLFVKNRAKVMAGPVVPRDEFTPPPKVDSQVVIMEPFIEGPLVPEEVFKLVRQGFSSPRKKLVHNLAGVKSADELKEILGELGVSPDARPGELHLEDWGKLYRALKEDGISV